MSATANSNVRKRKHLLRHRARLAEQWDQLFPQHDFGTGQLRFEQDVWADPGWAESAREYHEDRAGRPAVVEIKPERLARLRKLMADNVSRRRAIIAELLKENPTKSDRAIAKEAKTHHHAVAKIRQEEEGRGNLSHVEKRTDTKGRQQPAEKPRKLLPLPKPPLAVALRPQPEPAPLAGQKPLSGDAWWDQEPSRVRIAPRALSPRKEED
jgi:hypothetical protein